MVLFGSAVIIEYILAGSVHILVNNCNADEPPICLYKFVPPIVPGFTDTAITGIPSAAHLLFNSLLNRIFASLEEP